MLTDRKVTGAGFQLIIHSGSLSAKVQEAVKKGLKVVAEEYHKQIIKAISLDDHSLEELRALGHPYSTDLPAGNLHGDDRLVHEQTGKLRRSIQIHPVEGTTTRRFSIYVSSNAPYLPYLLYGTSRMRPRRFHELAYEKIKGRFWDPVLKELKNVKHRVAVNTRLEK